MNEWDVPDKKMNDLHVKILALILSVSIFVITGRC
jgi:hypothetical protein